VQRRYQIVSGLVDGFLLVTPEGKLAVETMRNVASRILDLRKKIEVNAIMRRSAENCPANRTSFDRR
jgi:hypothetical protein